MYDLQLNSHNIARRIAQEVCARSVCRFVIFQTLDECQHVRDACCSRMDQCQCIIQSISKHSENIPPSSCYVSESSSGMTFKGCWLTVILQEAILSVTPVWVWDLTLCLGWESRNTPDFCSWWMLLVQGLSCCSCLPLLPWPSSVCTLYLWSLVRTRLEGV